MPITKPNEVTIAVKRIVGRSSDGAGGYADIALGADAWKVICSDPIEGDWLEAKAGENTRRYTLAHNALEERLNGALVRTWPVSPWTAEGVAAVVDNLSFPGVSIARTGAIVFIAGCSAVTSDGDSFTVSVSGVPGSPFTGRLIRRPSRTAVGLVDAAQGELVRDEIVLVFAAGADIREGDVCTVDAVDYTVQLVRVYSRSVQADVLAVR